MKNLTVRQQEIYDLIKEAIYETGMPPTRVEIAKKLGFRSANAAEEHLKALAKKGYIEIIAGTSRGIRLLLEDDAFMKPQEGLPLIGKVAAGVPILAIEHIDSFYQVDANLFKPSADFLLRVEGMSMVKIGILDGDLLAVHKTEQVRNGQVIVARVDEDVTVKRLKREGNIIYLLAENDEFSPIVVDLRTQHFAIEGLAVGVIRNGQF
ncbi:transcriptional repressor LexA [Thorsellia anophelis]|uniref:LexA repressor n=1 Tax=Thorsellia anophelis DSM 18579 TaxID=1123402 RepID=A0A1H9YCK8_9GAMM|nr:transcriptional repressor LexA [Thorsellia anophelis]SES66599.1 repressor LexA [Thorsellia anophelis DSM 18579]